ncbi:MAG: hypothetical protein IBX39_00340 [Candidatus Methanoperedenaceae archaeon]|nr:hypothetical protein [Candidatus Methanoperedenaceae archaeon]
MANGELIEMITSIDEQIHNLRKMVLESGSSTKEDETRKAAKAWLAEAKKLEKKWPKTAPSVLDMIKKDRIHNE